jgi:hypothetical protein
MAIAVSQLPDLVSRIVSFAPCGARTFTAFTQGLRPFGKFTASSMLHSFAAARLLYSLNEISLTQNS